MAKITIKERKLLTATKFCVSRRSVADEAETLDLLHRKPLPPFRGDQPTSCVLRKKRSSTFLVIISV
ncbi:hypothetical protein SAMN05216202_1196 [Pseudomonas mucidolens]|uniref:Uncharacterized protein n=1 Tax=Pseudomonas mucidolens TaxID=46679 RepID=A0A1H2M7S8_9PSED|nr:hypothetical protein SAMN05216202_1196 [Pseudomonas mucidolens]SQH34374.1 Uncharacterised protein [Pseudomonas mucidolens]